MGRALPETNAIEMPSAAAVPAAVSVKNRNWTSSRVAVVFAAISATRG
jgi:hypothetical protein